MAGAASSDAPAADFPAEDPAEAVPAEDVAAEGVPAEDVPAEDAPAAGAPDTDSLTERDVAILAFERRGWRHAGAKEAGIRTEFGMSAARYYQLLGVLIDSPLALVHDPMLVKRLHRLREARLHARALRSLTPTESPLSLL